VLPQTAVVAVRRTQSIVEGCKAHRTRGDPRDGGQAHKTARENGRLVRVHIARVPNQAPAKGRT
jgi:hypothetical protein